MDAHRLPPLGNLFDADVLTTSAPIAALMHKLLPEERTLVARAAPSRQHEFATGRVCAREVLARVGIADFPILRNDDRTPVWPDGIVGSISHTRDVCVVALAKRGDVLSIGIDVEGEESLEPDLWPIICTEAELQWLATRAPTERGRLAKALFSAKECTYKCLYPVMRIPLEFDDVEIDLDLESRRFHATLDASAKLHPLMATALTGTVLCWKRWILTGATLRRAAAGSLRTSGPTNSGETYLDPALALEPDSLPHTMHRW